MTDGNLKRDADEFASQAKAKIEAKAKRQAEAVQDKLAGTAQETADAASAAAAQFDPQSMQAEATRRIADQIDGVANRIRATDLETVAHDVSNFARRNPLLFIGAAAVVGFAATRFLKAQGPEQVPHPHGDPWNTADETYSNENERPVHTNGGYHA